MAGEAHPLAPAHVPGFIVAADGSDFLMSLMGVTLPLIVFGIGTLYFWLHALPEQIAHRSSKVQYQFVAVLALLALFTHNHIFWIAGLLLALVDLPDFTAPLGSMARALDRIADRTAPPDDLAPQPQPGPEPAPAPAPAPAMPGPAA
jgi:hypothetical protein